jgi:hypothetical protein
MGSLSFEDPPGMDDASVPTREEIGAALTVKRGHWAIVARHDRAARAESHAERINAGREYGAGFDALVRRVGNEHRVYARRAAR